MSFMPYKRSTCAESVWLRVGGLKSQKDAFCVEDLRGEADVGRSEMLRLLQKLPFRWDDTTEMFPPTRSEKLEAAGS